MIINNQKVGLGESKVVQIPISKLASGTELYLSVHVFRSKNNGPGVLFAGGLHGDEINGVEIVRKAIEKKYFEELSYGTVIAIPLINTIGFVNYARETSGKDVNRSFPGSLSGSLASLIAYKLTNEILPYIDFGIDFHTGGSSIHNYPQVRVSKEDEVGLKIAKQTRLPFIVKKSTIPKSHRKQALSSNKSLLVFEGGESLRLDDESIELGLQAIKNLLVSNKMMKGKVAGEASDLYSSSKWQRSPVSGIFIPSKKAGDRVKKNEVIGEVNILSPLSKVLIKAKDEGVLIGHRNNPVIVKGDALFHLAIK
jgi:predicted deacylase